MMAAVEIRITWENDSHSMTQSFRGMSRKHILDKAIKFACKLPCFADREEAGQRVEAEAKILTTVQ